MFQALTSVTMHSVWLLAASCCWYEWLMLVKKKIHHVSNKQGSQSSYGRRNTNIHVHTFRFFCCCTTFKLFSRGHK
jgi:hypothetical protein